MFRVGAKSVREALDSEAQSVDEWHNNGTGGSAARVMLHSLVACASDGTLRIAHYFVESTPEQQAALELELSKHTSHLWEVAQSVAVPVEVVEGLDTVIIARDGLVFLASCITDSGHTSMSLTADCALLADVVNSVCDGAPAARLASGTGGFLGKAVVALEQAACGGIVAYSHVENVLRAAKLKPPKTA
jgi:hypothetical protein